MHRCLSQKDHLSFYGKITSVFLASGSSLSKYIRINLITKQPILVPLTELFLGDFTINLKLLYFSSVCLFTMSRPYCLHKGSKFNICYSSDLSQKDHLSFYGKITSVFLASGSSLSKYIRINLITKQPILVPLTELFLGDFTINLKLLYFSSVCLFTMSRPYCLHKGSKFNICYGKKIPTPYILIKGLDKNFVLLFPFFLL